MKVNDLKIAGLKLIEIRRLVDDRGFFCERFNQKTFQEAGFDFAFVQDNHSRSRPGVLRGLHYQFDPPQGKLIGCVRGRIWDVAVDLRPDSSTFGQYEAIELSDERSEMLWIPSGLAHGFVVLGDHEADVIYKVDSLYNGQGEGSIHWADPDLDISWPIKNPLLSPKDAAAPSFDQYRRSHLADRRWWP